MRSDPAHPPRVLVVAWGLLGDTILCTPAVRALRLGLPEAHLAFSCHTPWADLFRDPTQVDEVLPVNRRSWKGLAGWFRRNRDLEALAGQGWDLVLDCCGGGDTRRLLGRMRAKGIAAVFPRPGVPGPPPEILHQSDRCLAAAALLGGKGSDRSYQVGSHLSQGRLPRGGARLRIAINPGAGGPQKRWPLARFQALAEQLRSQCAAEITVLWGPGEEDLAAQIAQDAAELAPPTTPVELARLLGSVDLLISGDSGPMHLAAAVGCPVVALFSTADPAQYLPPGQVVLVRHPGRIDLGGMSVASVFEATVSLVDA